MISCKKGIIEYEGNGYEISADVATLVIAVRDILCQEAENEDIKQCVMKGYEQLIIRSLATTVGQSDQDRRNARKNP